MAKAIMSAESDLGDLVNDLLVLSQEFPEVVKVAANAQMTLFSDAIKMNWASMIPWGSVGDFVYDSIGYNVDWGNTGNDVVGMAGVFKIDALYAKHGKDPKNINAPQRAYWAEYGFTPNNGRPHSGIPFMSNAYYATLPSQETIFAEVLSEQINKRLK